MATYISKVDIYPVDYSLLAAVMCVQVLQALMNEEDDYYGDDDVVYQPSACLQRRTIITAL
jgi:hypothetical protein